jgi:hypothetical protein
MDTYTFTKEHLKRFADRCIESTLAVLDYSEEISNEEWKIIEENTQDWINYFTTNQNYN